MTEIMTIKLAKAIKIPPFNENDGINLKSTYAYN